MTHIYQVCQAALFIGADVQIFMRMGEIFQDYSWIQEIKSLSIESQLQNPEWSRF